MARPDCDQQQRARSLKSSPSRPGRAASEGRLWSDDNRRQCYQYAWQAAILRENWLQLYYISYVKVQNAGIWHLNYLCGGDIDIYIPQEKPNTYLAMQTVCNTYTEMLGNAIWRLRIQENPSAAGARPRTPLRELTALPQTPSWWGGAGCSLPKKPIPPLSALAVVVGDW